MSWVMDEQQVIVLHRFKRPASGQGFRQEVGAGTADQLILIQDLLGAFDHFCFILKSIDKRIVIYIKRRYNSLIMHIRRFL